MTGDQLREAAFTIFWLWLLYIAVVVWVLPIWRDRPVVVYDESERRWRAQRDLRGHR